MAEINNPFKTNEVVGVAPSEKLDVVTAALEAADFEIEVLKGPADADKIDIEGDDLASKIVRFFQHGKERETLEHFVERLRAGDHVVRVIDVDERAEEAGRTFVDCGGETIWHYGEWTYRKLHDGTR